MPKKDDKGEKEMSKVEEEQFLAQDPESRVQVKDGMIVLDRKNPLHRIWFEEDEE